MKGDPKVIELLNEALKAELTAINQYWLHYRLLDNWGLKKLAEFERGESIDEMKHADVLIERILYLEGLPNVQKLDKVHTGETVAEQLRLDLDNELSAVARLNHGIKLARELGDNGSAELMEDILKSEDEHIEWLEAQLELIRQVGEQNYLAQQMKG